ncbi:MAG: TlpA family protein disulfide reductase [Sedimentisphaerales bacterium]|nr:TlpA family protein disulfide reductase [Sedimentisphaerales bacterium]
MANSKAKFIIWLGLAALAAGVLVGCEKKPQPAPANDQNQTTHQQTTVPQHQAEPNPTAKPVAGSTGLATSQPTNDPKPTLRDIIARRRGWGPAYANWQGKEAPDFTVTDINGRQHTLSEYRGKNVMLTFWATWCRPCIMEIPHLIELRNTIGEDKLAILAISYIGPMNSTERVKKFIAANPVINYTVISTDGMSMPRPYNLVTTIPSSFFIDPQGRIKLATEGLIPLKDTKAIIKAER